MDIKVKMLKDIPAYNGADDLRFGPFNAGEVTELPESEARWMVKGKLAEALEPLPIGSVLAAKIHEAALKDPDYQKDGPISIGLMQEAISSVKLDGETQSEPTGQDPDGTIDNAGLEKMEPTEPRKRKKYAPRGGASCPVCNGNLRTAFCTINEGGLKASNRIQICPKCDEGYKITRMTVPEIIIKKAV